MNKYLRHIPDLNLSGIIYEVWFDHFPAEPDVNVQESIELRSLRVSGHEILKDVDDSGECAVIDAIRDYIEEKENEPRDYS